MAQADNKFITQIDIIHSRLHSVGALLTCLMHSYYDQSSVKMDHVFSPQVMLDSLTGIRELVQEATDACDNVTFAPRAKHAEGIIVQ